MALSGNEGYFYVADVASTHTTDDPTSGNWYKIKSQSTDGSGLPSNLTTGDVFYQAGSGLPSTDLTTGDEIYAITLTKAAFVTDVPASASREKFEDTVQIDDVRSYQVSSKPEKTGTINGYWLVDNDDQLSFVKQFGTVVEGTTTGGLTRTSPETDVIHTFMSRSESTEEERQVWEYKPLIVESYSADKPMEGPQTFSVNYTEDGKEKPATYGFDNT